MHSFQIKTVKIDKREKGGELVDGTIAWVRKTSTQRRKKYREGLKHKKDTTLQCQSNEQIYKCLERGKALLACTEAHLKQFDEYFEESSNQICERQKCSNEAFDGDKICEPKNIPQNVKSNGVNVHYTIDGKKCNDKDANMDASIEKTSQRRLDKLKERLEMISPMITEKKACDANNESEIILRNLNQVEKNQGTGNSIDLTPDGDVEKAIKYLKTLKINSRKKVPSPLEFTNDNDEIVLQGEKNAFDSEKSQNSSEKNIDYGTKMNQMLRKRCNDDIVMEQPSSFKKKLRQTSVTKPLFDPSQLLGAKRAAINAAKREQEIVAAKAYAEAKSIFKARPLPGGIWVHNDPYKPTQAALGKNKTKNDDTAENDSHIDFDETGSPIFMKKYQGESKVIQFSKESETNLIYGKITKFDLIYLRKLFFLQIEKTNPSLLMDFNHEAHSCFENKIETQKQVLIDTSLDDKGNKDDDEGEYNTFYRTVAKLGTRIQHRKKYLQSLEQKLKKAQSFNLDELTCTRIMGSKTATKEDKKSNLNIHKSYHKFHISGENEINISDAHNQQQECSVIIKTNKTKDNSLVYRRQEKWLNKVHNNRAEAQAKKEMILLEGLTGKPEIHDAEKSWEKAKAAHAAVIQRIQEESNNRQSAKEMRAQQLHEQKLAAYNAVKVHNAKKIKSSKNSNVNKVKQKEVMEKLSHPRNNTTHNHNCDVNDRVQKRKDEENDEIDRREANIIEEVGKKKKNRVNKNTQNDSPCSKSTPSSPTFPARFDDMNDKEFALMMKKLGVTTSNPSRGNQRAGNAKPKIENISSKERILKLIQHVEQKLQTAIPKDASKDKTMEPLEKQIPASDSKQDTTSFSFENNITMGGELNCNDDIDNLENDLEPYEKYEAGKVPFYDRSSSSDKGRFRVRDVRDFVPSSMKRKPFVPFCDGNENQNRDDSSGITLLIGKKDSSMACHNELVITIIFEKTKYTEASARKWWRENRARFVEQDKR